MTYCLVPKLPCDHSHATLALCHYCHATLALCQYCHATQALCQYCHATLALCQCCHERDLQGHRTNHNSAMSRQNKPQYVSLNGQWPYRNFITSPLSGQLFACMLNCCHDRKFKEEQDKSQYYVHGHGENYLTPTTFNTMHIFSNVYICH